MPTEPMHNQALDNLLQLLLGMFKVRFHDLHPQALAFVFFIGFLDAPAGQCREIVVADIMHPDIDDGIGGSLGTAGATLEMGA